ncbi:uncharacterized protein LOC105801197 [Gossypium raimondii]|uniref:uncharacterized protein LOC105801197 n=1 Tax=Gossypium raimondii TaxID=29730 RepID=UPI00063AA9E8|nr:uncharacterized protein LOC105801197 [Gossypium raimondii]
MQYKISQSQEFNQQAPKPPQVESSNSLENLLKVYMAKNDALIQSQSATLKNLENQIAEPELTKSNKVKSKPMNSNKLTSLLDADLPHQKSCLVQPKVLSPPCPHKFQPNKQKHEVQFKKFLDILKQLHINIPLVEALEQIFNYVKFMKEILSKKKRLSEYETVALTKECSTFPQNKLPLKLKDLGSFTIPCNIGESYCGKDLCDLGAIINLMPKSIFKLLGIGEVKPTTVTLQLAD